MERPDFSHIEYKRFDKADLEKIFPQNNADGSFNFGIIAIHGNEPQRLLTAVSLEISKILKEHGLTPPVFVLPDIYGEDSKRILREEFPSNLSQIFMSEELGAILKQTQFGQAGYQDHMEEVAEKQPKVYEEVLAFFEKPFIATSLSGETREFFPAGRRLELNAGANVVASQPGERKTHFYFPVILSELVAATMEDPTINFTYDQDTMERVRRIAQEFEKTYSTTQLGYVHTLSFEEDYSTGGKIFTPAPKKAKEPPNIDLENGIYIMASGSGIGVETVVNQAKRLSQEGYEIVSPPWIHRRLQIGIAATPDVIFHPGIKAVIGRAGWGILWDAQKAEKPFADIGAGEYDNPEIRFNRRTIQKLGLGDAFSLRRGFIEGLVELSPNIASLNRQIARDLSISEDYDGERYAAEKIIEAEINRLGNNR